jgi:phosphatidylglycerol:prolipoprotein diacylglycerol transferase
MQIAAIPFPEISPELFSIEFGSFRFALRWYALAYIAGILIGWRLCTSLIRKSRLWRTGSPPVTPQQFEDLVIWIVLGVILGGRLGFILFYQPAFYLQNPLEILKVWQGGMSFHGGFLGVTIAVLVYCARHRVPFFSTTDLLAIAAPIGLFFGRIANFINNELWGRPTDVWWGVTFPGELAQNCPGIEGLCARHPSQLYEALLEGVILGGLLLYLALRQDWLKRPGALTGVFLAGYGTARSLVEFFRQPDTQFVTLGNPIGHALHFDTWGLTMGQLLSLPLIMLGLGLICIGPHGRPTAVSETR